MEGRANHGAHMRSKHDAPNYIAEGQTPSVSEVILADLERVLLPLVNGVEPQVEAGKMIIHVMVEVGSVKARGTRPSAAPGQRGSVLFLLESNSAETTRNIRTTLTTRLNTTRTCIATIPTYPTNCPTTS